MNLSSVKCPICGAKILAPKGKQHFTCRYCSFERRQVLEARQSAESSFEDIAQILALKQVYEIYVDGVQTKNLQPFETEYQVKLIPNANHIQNIDCIWSPMILPFQEDLAGFFMEKFRQLKPDGLLYLSTPVMWPFQKNAPLAGQVNFFRSRNIMFLLEQHGFKMAWRKNRFSTKLKIIARRN